METGACLNGRAPEALSTYSAERSDIAKKLIDFDREWSKMFSTKPKPKTTQMELIQPSFKNTSSYSPDLPPG